jgi:hypothetical protein
MCVSERGGRIGGKSGKEEETFVQLSRKIAVALSLRARGSSRTLIRHVATPKLRKEGRLLREVTGRISKKKEKKRKEKEKKICCALKIR